MKTFARLIRRYVLAAAGIISLLVTFTIGLIVWIGWRESNRNLQREFASGIIADTMVPSDTGRLEFSPEHTPEEWMNGYAWAMVLDENGCVIWQYRLPEALNHRYTASDIARFSRWYLEDYPVFCWTEDYGLFVIGLDSGSLWRYNLYASPGMLLDFSKSLIPMLCVMLLVGLAVCFLLSWKGARQLKAVAMGLEALAQGQPVSLPCRGFTGELAQKLNQTSQQLQKRNAIIARRDGTRTQWIAGVSHDVRTPLALILGWAEQLQGDEHLPAWAQQKAGDICSQVQRLRSLIEDLNLTSKLQYGAQPLRKEPMPLGPMLREFAARFCDGPFGKTCDISLEQTDEAERAVLYGDKALLERALENLLNNSVRHNPGFVQIGIAAEIQGNTLHLAVADDGVGYPEAVLAALAGNVENAPHILGLHVVEQIVEAHGGRVEFGNGKSAGARTLLWLPLEVE